MPRTFTQEVMNAMPHPGSAFAPPQSHNPGNMFPPPRLCGERPGPFHMHPVQKAGLAENV